MRRGSPWMSLGGTPPDIHGRESARYISDEVPVRRDRGYFDENGLDVAVGTVFGGNHFLNGMK
jgi:hypothetical protein